MSVSGQQVVGIIKSVDRDGRVEVLGIHEHPAHAFATAHRFNVDPTSDDVEWDVVYFAELWLVKP